MDLEKHTDLVVEKTGIQKPVVAKELKQFVQSWGHALDQFPEDTIIEKFCAVLKAKYRKKTQTVKAVFVGDRKGDNLVHYLIIANINDSWIPMWATYFGPSKKINRETVYEVSLKSNIKNGREFFNITDIQPTSIKTADIADLKHIKHPGIVLSKGEPKQFEWGQRVFLTVITDEGIVDVADTPQHLRDIKEGDRIYILKIKGNRYPGWAMATDIDPNWKPRIAGVYPVIRELTDEALAQYHNKYVIIECAPITLYTDNGSIKITDLDGNVRFARLSSSSEVFQINPEWVEETDIDGVMNFVIGKLCLLTKIRQYTAQTGELQYWILVLHAFTDCDETKASMPRKEKAQIEDIDNEINL